MDQCFWNENQFAAVIAHRSDSAHTIFAEIVKFSYDKIPTRCQKKAYNDSVCQLGWRSIHSQLKVTTDIHGITPNLLHLTEVSRFSNAKELINEALQSVPLLSGEVIQESTANGVGGYFYDAWNEATEDPETVWQPIFLKWWEHPDYTLLVPEGFVCTEEEEDFKRQYGITDGNVYFRRVKIKEMQGKKIDAETGLSGEMLFCQSYPMTPQQAFVVRSGSLFNVEILTAMLTSAPAPLDIQQIGRGHLRVYKHIQPGHSYLLVCDPSYGQSKDYAAAIVFDMITKDFVAVFHGKYRSNELAKHLVKLAKFYNGALIVVERNTGQAVLNQVISFHDYRNIYHHKEWSDRREPSWEPGFPTTATTRNLFLASLEDAISDRVVVIPDQATVKECLNFGDKDGKYQATVGNDDLVIALAIGTYLLQQPRANLLPPSMELRPGGL